MRWRERIRWHANEWVVRHLAALNRIGGRLSIVSQFATPGDTLLAGTVGHVVKDRWPRLRLNAVVRQPELLAMDPAFAEINGRLGAWRLTFHYLTILGDKRPDLNLLRPTMDLIGIRDYEYQSRVYLAPAERSAAQARVAHLRRPIVTINVMSREPTKTWLLDSWSELVGRLLADFDVVQLGDDSEPRFDGVHSFAGRLSLRESMAVLGAARVHVGPVSFLMHAANGLGIPAVVIYGGRETPANSGYALNRNLHVDVPCGPCWLHHEKGERCAHAMICMRRIGVEQVYAEVRQALTTRQEGSSASRR